MKSVKFPLAGSICATSLLGVCLISGCNSTSAARQHPDEVDSVTNALAFNGLSNVKVSQDRTKGVMTLTGSVASPGLKAQAATITSTNASDYTIANDVAVTPPVVQAKADSNSEIEKKYQAMLKAHSDLDLRHIDYKVDRGTIVLSGKVHKASERNEAVKLAKSVPKVQHVVDEIKVQS